MKDSLTPEDQQLITRFLTEVDTMRNYQKKFFDGNKSVLKTSMYWENQVDNSRKLVQQRLEVELIKSKGNASQGSML